AGDSPASRKTATTPSGSPVKRRGPGPPPTPPVAWEITMGYPPVAKISPGHRRAPNAARGVCSAGSVGRRRYVRGHSAEPNGRRRGRLNNSAW
ncbi:unnamed protein product, partial [Sphacelaria rigidula]